MTDDLRDRLRDLAGEMPALHAPSNLETRVHRREVGILGAAVIAAVVIVLVAIAGFRMFDRGAPTVPANPESFPFPVATEPVPGTSVLLQAPEGLMVDSSGSLFISEWYGNKVDVLTPDGSLATIAGVGSPGYGGDGGRATSASVDSPAGMALAPDGSLLFVDNGNSCIRRIDRSGTVTTVAGRCGFPGDAGDGGPATDAQLSRPIGITIDPVGGFYFSDNDFGLVRHVDAGGRISTIAGAGDVSPLEMAAAGVKASSLDLGRTSYVLLDAAGNLYVTDLQLNIIVKIDPLGTATLIAGTGKPGYSGDGGSATHASLNFPAGLAIDHRGDLFVADSDNNVIREIDTAGIIRTVAGTGVAGNSGDGGRATRARLLSPSGLAYGNGILYIADQQNDFVRRVDASGVIMTVAGS